jgi:DNA polymerase III delta prime subunit
MGFFEEKKETKNVDNSLWVERYRPRELKNYVGNEHLKEKVGNYIETGDVPHLLLYGVAGTGKTTLAKLIVNQIDCDYMLINASDENNVETVRNKVKNFAASVGFKNLKVIILDEFDYMTPNAQAILRNLMETFSKHCRFILTCNYIEKVISPIQSRCQTFQVIPPTKKDVAKQLAFILNEEKIEFKLEDIVPIVDSNYPDIRKIINTAQLNTSKGVLKVDTSTIIESDVKTKVLEILKSGTDNRDKFMKIRKAVADSHIRDFTEFYSYLYEKVNEYTNEPSGVILMLAEGEYKDAMVVDKEIVFAATIIKVLEAM